MSLRDELDEDTYDKIRADAEDANRDELLALENEGEEDFELYNGDDD